MNDSEIGTVSREFTIDVAGVTMSARAADEALVLEVPPLLEAFIVDAEGADVCMTVHYDDPPETDGASQEVFDSDGVWRLYRVDRGYVLTLATPVVDGGRPFRVACFDDALAVADLYVRPLPVHEERRLPDGRVPICPWEYPIDELLVVNKIADGRGVNIHGCAVSDGESGRLFVGVSGAGKTTIARLWQKHGVDILSDDRLIVRMIDDQAWVFGTPWAGEARAAMHEGVPLSAIYFLDQAPENRLTQLSRMEAMTRLLVCCFPTFYFKEGMENTMSLLTEIARHVPAYELSFVPDDRVVDLLMSHEP